MSNADFMITSSRNNRVLLKGAEGTKYKNFDISAYRTSSKRSIPSYLQASPDLLSNIKSELQAENKRLVRKIVIFFSALVLVIGTIMSFLIFFTF